jgi:hypothetical protein
VDPREEKGYQAQQQQQQQQQQPGQAILTRQSLFDFNRKEKRSLRRLNLWGFLLFNSVSF